MAKGLMEENQQPSVHQKIERLSPSTSDGGREDESREFHRLGAGESSASTTTDTNTSSATPSTTNWTIAEIWGSKTCGDSQYICYFFHVKLSDFRFVTWFMSILKFGLPQLSFEVFQTKTKTELFRVILVSSKSNIKSNGFEFVLSKKACSKLCFRKQSGQ